jgi:hypothetical protein
MALTDIQAVRVRIADKSQITRERAESPGDTVHFKLGHAPISLLPAPEVRKNDLVKSEGIDYTVDYSNAIISFSALPVVNDDLEFIYYWSIFTDDEIQYFLDDSAGSVNIASAKALLAIAADAAKIAQRQSLAGGGGLGAVSIDTSVAARELRALAQTLIDQEQDIANNTPYDQLTEVVWNDQSLVRGLDQHLIRES